MANTTPLALCPHCSTELPFPIPAVCPNTLCRVPIEKQKNPHFATPDYVSYQLDDKLDEYTREDRSRPMTPEDFAKKAEIQSAFRAWCRDAHILDRVAALRDARDLLAWLPHSDLSFPGAEDFMRNVSSLSKSIGELGRAIDTYYASGGVTRDTEVRPILPVGGDPSRRAETID